MDRKYANTLSQPRITSKRTPFAIIITIWRFSFVTIPIQDIHMRLKMILLTAFLKKSRVGVIIFVGMESSPPFHRVVGDFFDQYASHIEWPYEIQQGILRSCFLPTHFCALSSLLGSFMKYAPQSMIPNKPTFCLS